MDAPLEPTPAQLKTQLKATLVRLRRLQRLCRRQGQAMTELQTAQAKLERERDQWREKAEALELQLKVSKLATRLEQESQREDMRRWLDRLIARVDEALKHLS